MRHIQNTNSDLLDTYQTIGRFAQMARQIKGQDPNICSHLIAHFAPDTIDTHGFPRHRVSELDRDMHAWPLAAAFEVPT